MDGMLSQDEINALLNGMDLSGDEAPDAGSQTQDAGDAVAPTFDIEPEAFLRGTQAVDGGEEPLTDVEKDAIGEVGNISMGSSATTLYSLVNRKVNITTPNVELARWEEILANYEKPCVFIQIKYTKGLDGTNILVLKEHDVKVITDLMMGGDGTNTEGELGELHLSAISEAMNQMMGAAATSLSTMLQSMIDISPPEASLLDLTKFSSGGDIAPFLAGTFVRIAFRMQIGEDDDPLVDSTIMQLYPIEFAKKLVETFINTQTGGMKEDAPIVNNAAPDPAPAPSPQPQQQAAPQPDMGMQGGQMGMGMGMPQMDMSGMNPQMGMGMQGGQMGMGMGMPQMGMNPYMYPQMGMGMGMPQMGNMANVNVQPAQFQSFSSNVSSIQGQENIGLIMDVPLEVAVELGRTTKSISEILNFAPGTIIELDRIAGEPIDVLVNGKHVAKGEVVVIEESFGVRVTEIIKD